MHLPNWSTAHRRLQWLALALIVVLAAGLRIYQLKDVPAGLFCDEAGNGYDAFSIATAGTDENGNVFPLFFWSFGVSYKNPVFIYAAALPVKLLGLDEFSVRLTAALFGIGTVLGMFFLGRALRTPGVGLLAALFLAVCPWHLHFSRIAFELISFPFLFVIGVTLLVRFTQGRRTLPAALFCFGLCIYAYAIAYLFVPLFLLGFGVLYLPTLWRRWRETLLALVVVLATVAPAARFLHRNQQSGTQYFRNTTMLRPGEDTRQQLERLGHYYTEFFSRSFLLDQGDPIVRHAVHGFGELLWFYAPFLLLGAVVSVAARNRPSKLILWWLALYPIAPSLMTEIPSASRGIIGAPAFCLLTAIGVAAVLRVLGWLAHWRPLALAVQAAALAGGAYVLVPQVQSYLKAYFIEYPKYSAPTYGGFQYGYRDVIHYMESQRSNYDLLMLTAVEVNQPQIFPLFYNHVDPRELRARHHDLGYMILDPTEYARYAMNQRILYALRPGDLDYFTDYTVHQNVVAPGGQVEFVIAEVRARKHYLTGWLGLGLFDNTDGKGVNQNFIDVQHPPSTPVRGAFGEVSWRPIGQQFVRVDLNLAYSPSDPRSPGNPEWDCAYAAITVRSPAATHAYLELSGSDDWIQLWLNGATLTPWPMMLNERLRRRPIDLAAGNNLLVAKSCESVGSWFFAARVVDADGRDVPDITTAAEIPPEVTSPPASPAVAEVQLVEGFDSIVRFQHTQNPYPDYRGGTESWWATVADEHSEVVWRTAPCPAAKPTVFAFTASVSDQPAEADLFVNGQQVLTFTLGADREVKTWTQDGYTLAFVSKASAAGNSGLALLSVPAAQITPGRAVEVRVVPARGHNDGWFMIKAYRDTLPAEHITPAMAAEALRGAWK